MTHGILANMGDCAFLRAPSGTQLTYAIRMQACVSPGAPALRAAAVYPAQLAEPRDMVNAALWGP